MITRNLGNPYPATLREKSFVLPSQQMISGTVGNDQDFQQTERRRNQLPASTIDFSEKQLEHAKKLERSSMK
jgi:hypothetical protein